MKTYYMRFNVSANSWSVFQQGRKNEFGEPYCALPLVTKEEAERFISNALAEDCFSRIEKSNRAIEDFWRRHG